MKLTKRTIKKYLYKVLTKMFPSVCVLCDKEGELICNKCSNKLKKHDLECHVCHRKFTEEYFKQTKRLVCDKCLNKTNIKAVYIGFYYDKNLKKIIEYCKYDGYYYILLKLTKLLKFLIKPLKETLRSKDTILVPVPMFFLKENMRGFNQSEKLCEYVRDVYNYNYSKLLTKVRPTRRQVGKSIEERQTSQKGVFRINFSKAKLIDNYSNIILIDDVMTTGSTLEECARILKEYTPNINIYALVVGRGEIDTNSR